MLTTPLVASFWREEVALRGGLGVHHHGELRLCVLHPTEGADRGAQPGKGLLHAHSDGLQAEELATETGEKVMSLPLHFFRLTRKSRSIGSDSKNSIRLSHR